MIASLKERLPAPVVRILKDILSRQRQITVFRYDKKRFVTSFSRAKLRKNSEDQLAARLTFHAHAIEKGLSHADIRFGFGSTALTQMSACLQAFGALSYPKQHKAYVNALSVLKEYIKTHEAHGFSTEFLTDIFPSSLIADISESESNIGGVNQLEQENGVDKSETPFAELFNKRASVREYSDTKVDRQLIDRAISVALKSPSICNRQAARVTVLSSPEKIGPVLKLQGGMTGYDSPPILLMISTDSSAFIDVTERNQVYIDGGIFAMSLLLALESVSLASCPLNAMFTVPKEKQMRRLLDIPASENIIMFVSVGHFLEEVKVPRSFRYSVQDIRRNVT